MEDVTQKAKEFLERAKREYIEEGREFSNCCGAVIYKDTDICSNCEEHCEKEEE